MQQMKKEFGIMWVKKDEVEGLVRDGSIEHVSTVDLKTRAPFFGFTHENDKDFRSLFRKASKCAKKEDCEIVCKLGRRWSYNDGASGRFQFFRRCVSG